MEEALIENGAAKVPAGTWLCGRAQPAASLGAAVVKGLRGFVVPDRAFVRTAEVAEAAWFASADAPFLTRLPALPDEPLRVVSSKVLVAPAKSRTGAKSLKLIPMSFKRATPVTAFNFGWVVSATRSRVARVALEDGQTLTVRPESLVAWIGKDPTGTCPKLSLLDVILPRGPKGLSYSFHGPGVVWFEGASEGVRGKGVRPWPTR